MWGKHYKKKGQFEAVATEPEGPKESRNGFASQLHFLVDTLQMSLKAHFIKYFVTAAENPRSDNLKSSTVVPSPTVGDCVLKERLLKINNSTSNGHSGKVTIPGKSLIQICESSSGVITLAGSTEVSISTLQEMAAFLEQGSLNRATRSTNMNNQSW
ncbi:kinesin protein KIN-4A [Trifolium repens]|nr:kinesin protein KIN-4A [Trifolium repens]